MNKLPTRRTLLKFGRGLLLAVAAVSISWALDHAADLELGTQGTAVLVAVLGLAYRWVRGLSGKEPLP